MTNHVLAVGDENLIFSQSINLDQKIIHARPMKVRANAHRDVSFRLRPKNGVRLLYFPIISVNMDGDVKPKHLTSALKKLFCITPSFKAERSHLVDWDSALNQGSSYFIKVLKQKKSGMRYYAFRP